MILKAKVTLPSVKIFLQSVVDVRDYSVKFDTGLSCIEHLHNELLNQISALKEKNSEMQIAKEKLAIKIDNIEEIIAKLTARIMALENEVSELEGKLAGMSATYTVTNEQGETYEVANPAYLALEAKISTLESEISRLETQLLPHQQRLEKANSVDGRLSSYMDAVNGIIYSLEEKKSVCKMQQQELIELKNLSSRKSSYATENLRKLRDVVEQYMRLKMSYDNANELKVGSTNQGSSGININININKTIRVEGEENAHGKHVPEPRVYSKEEIEENQIRFNKERRVSEFAGKKFGGNYNDYDTRVKGTSLDNPMLGFYEGERGESKYIPSNRTAEGIVVIRILEEYGLDGIEYRNAEPDFEVCAEAVLKIAKMSENRDSNFLQADAELAKLWNFDEREGRCDWTGRDVLRYRKANQLTWHEKCDTETMVCVRTEINSFFKHGGGCSECKTRDAVIENNREDGGFDE